MTNKKQDIADLLHFLDASPTAWHAVKNSVAELLQHGFSELKEGLSWELKPGGKYFITRNGSSLCAFIIPKKTPTSLHVAASHTDSPTFKLKPNAEFLKENMVMLGLEIYGGPLLSSWLNRDLGIAGRVIYTDKKGNQHEELVSLDESPIVIPQLAIHLDRNVNESGPVMHKQDHLAALATLDDTKQTSDAKKVNTKKKDSYLLRQLKKVLPIDELLSYDLFVYPLEKARLIGENQEFVSSYRIDSLASVHAILQGFLETLTPSTDQIKMIVFWDNEEIGSSTAQGAGSPFLLHLIERITLALKMSREAYFQMLSQSLCASVDLVHAQHPNYADKHEPRHPVFMSKGIVIKTSAQHRYASDARSSAAIIALCNANKIPFQRYAARGDIPCGSTVGPIHAGQTGMATVDIGCTQLSMHSARELTSSADHHFMTRLMTAFLKG